MTRLTRSITRYIEVVTVVLGVVILSSCTVGGGVFGYFAEGVKGVAIGVGFLLLGIAMTAFFVGFVFVITGTHRDVDRIGERLDALEHHPSDSHEGE